MSRGRARRSRRGAIVGALLAALATGGPATAAGPAFSHAPLDSVLKAHVREGRVDYGGLSRDHATLDRYLRAAAEARPDAWPRGERMAFWINVYNARVLDGVIRRPGLASVMETRDSAGVPQFFRERRRSGGRELSLDDIEHKILRAQYTDPRVHFVLTCASVSCPVLPDHPVSAAKLGAELDAATARFLADSTRNHIRPPATPEVSEIFRWYESDFAVAGGARAFIAQHWTGRDRLAPGGSLRYIAYDWTLNGTW